MNASLLGALALGAAAIILAVLAVMGGLAFVAPAPLLLLGVPAVLLFRKAQGEFVHDESTAEGRAPEPRSDDRPQS